MNIDNKICKAKNQIGTEKMIILVRTSQKPRPLKNVENVPYLGVSTVCCT